MGREEGKRMRCHMRGFVPLGGHSPREEKEPLELPPLEASLAISITAAPEARWIDGVWHGEGQKHCMALPSLRSSASFSLGEPGGRKWEGWLPSDSSAHLSTSWRRAVGVTRLPKEQLKNHIRSLDSETTAGVGSGLSPRGNGTAEAADRGLRDAQVPALAPRLTECLQQLLPARKPISRYSKRTAFCYKPPPRAPSFVPAPLLTLSQHGLEHPATGQGLNSIAGQN